MAPPAASPKQWMLGLPGHNEVMRFEEVLVLVKGGQLRPTDLVKKLGEPWRAANEMPELLEYFTEPRRIPAAPETQAGGQRQEAPRPAAASPSAAKSPAPPPPPPASPRRPEPTDRMARPMTARAPAAPPPAAERRPPPATGRIAPPTAVPKPQEAPKTETRPPESPRSETKPPEAAKSETKPPDVSKEETKHPPAVEDPGGPSPGSKEETPPPSPEGKPRLSDSRFRDRRSRPVPKPPLRLEPVLEPMVGKYLGPVDMLRCASFAFDPKKLLLSAAGVAPLGVLTGLLLALSGDRETPREWAMAIIAAVLCVFGLAFLCTALAYVTRRQLEGKEYSIAEVFQFAKSNAVLSVIYPLFAIAPSLFSVGVLYIFRWIRNSGSGGASFVKIAYIFPMAFAFLAVAGALLYQLASLYVPAAAAIEGLRVTGSVNTASNLVRRQWGRVVLHWLIITVAVGVILFVGYEMADFAIMLPKKIFGPVDPDRDVRVWEAWNNFSRLFTIYEGLAYALGLILPVSLLSTLGTLSYVSLRHPASAQLSPVPLEETSGIAISPSGTRAGSSNPADATQPGETRPAPPDATPVPPSDISDDSDEQPLVKD
jgi:hypothetical protein